NGVGFVQIIDTAFNYFKNTGIEGRIAAITSVAGTMGLGPSPSYSATKRMQWTYLEALAQLAHSQNLNIHFTDIRPGFVATDFLHGDNYPLLMEKEYAARKIYRALKNGRRIATIDWKYKLLCFVWRLIPRFIWERLNLTSR
ncbi:MAG: SDR family NAD(P)-dependent oxidoreductase, partial [Bacteroidales bacterium]|nr:SDR family NAD(P)-dependent oxidoreductase [Bacteroidales bacterium]